MDSLQSLQEVWVTYEGKEWELMGVLRNSKQIGGKGITTYTILSEALKVFQLDFIVEARARLAFNGILQPLNKELSEYTATSCPVLDFELILSHQASPEVSHMKTRYLSPLDPVAPSCDGFLDHFSELLYLSDDERLGVNSLVGEKLCLHASNTNYVPVVGLLGNTGSGKSLLTASLLDRETKLPCIRSEGQQGSTTANVNVYYDLKEEKSSESPLRTETGQTVVFLDFEGENGSLPKESINVRRKKVNRKNSVLAERRSLVKDLFPKLAYILCDIVIFITTDEIGSNYSVYDRCIDFAQRANFHLLDTDRPSLIIVHNKFNVSVGNMEQQLDVAASSNCFLETFDEDSQLQLFFSSCSVIRLPFISSIHDSAILRVLWDQQIVKIQETIGKYATRRYESRKAAGFQLTQTAWVKVLPRIIADVNKKKPLSIARYLQDLQQILYNNQSKVALDVFRCLFYSRDYRNVEWFYQCGSVAMDALGRSWGTIQYEEGLQLEADGMVETAELCTVLDILLQSYPCTASYKKGTKSYKCTQIRALHDHHRCSVEGKGFIHKLRHLVGKKTKTFVWEGEFEFAEHLGEEEIRSSFTNHFCSTALAFAQQDQQSINQILHSVFYNASFKESIWSLLLHQPQNKSSGSSMDPMREWAVQLAQYGLKMDHIDKDTNMWELATTKNNWIYLDSICRTVPFHLIELSSKKLGAGEQGAVYEGRYQREEDGKVTDCAIKEILLDSPSFDLASVRKEIVILSVIRHPRITRFFGYSFDKERNAFYLLQFKMQMNLGEWLRSYAPKEDILSILQVMLDIAEGVAVVHSFRIVHRDLTLKNILLIHERGRSWRATLADFGIARKICTDNMTRYVTNEEFVAPELLNFHSSFPTSTEVHYSQAVDVFSYGKIVQTIISSCIPPETEIELFAQICFLLEDCCHPDPALRPPMSAICRCFQSYMSER